MTEAEKQIRRLTKLAGININGKDPWDIQVHNLRFYKRALFEEALGVGESYMDGDWDSLQLDETIARINRADLQHKVKKNIKIIFFYLKNKFLNVATPERSYKVGEQHYDVGNELYERMLDHEMNYTCGYWKGLGDPLTAWKKPENLEKAQIAKMDLVCRKLKLKKGMKVLDTGCGFGNFARYAAANYGVKVVGCTVSIEQAKKATERCKGLPVKIYHKDYRELTIKDKFDAVASIGIMEHITHKNYGIYLQQMYDFLKPEGRMLLHTIGTPVSVTSVDPWTEKYIFPNSHLPSMAQIAHAAENKFIIEDVQNFGLYYYPTLMSWHARFNKSWKELTRMNPGKYDERFRRMWNFYLMSSAGGFKSKSMLLFQIVLSKGQKPEIYEAVR